MTDTGVASFLTLKLVFSLLHLMPRIAEEIELLEMESKIQE